MRKNKKQILIILTVFIAIFFTHLYVYATEKNIEGIVVWKLTAKTGVTEKEIDSISEYITSAISEKSGRKVISEEEVQTVLKGEYIKANCDPDNDICLSDISGALGVPEAVSGNLGKVGDIWIINLKRINVNKVEVISRVSRQINGKIDKVVITLNELVEELYGIRKIKKTKLKSNLLKNEDRIKIKSETSVYRILSYTSFAGVLLTLVTAVYGTLEMNQLDAAYKSYGNDTDYKNYDKWKTITEISYISSGILFAAGSALWFFDPKRNKKEESTVLFNIMNLPEKSGLILSINFKY